MKPEDKIIYLQDKIDNIISILFNHSIEHNDDLPKKEVVDKIIEEILPGKKDKFCPECFYSFNGVLDVACRLPTCKRFEE